jgi:mannosyltransferase
MLSAGIQARTAGPMQDWYGAAAWLERRFGPGDQIFAYPNEGALPLRYALRDRGDAFPIRPVPEAIPAQMVPGGWYATGSRGVVSLRQPQLRVIAQSPGTQSVPTIWLLRLGHPTYDPGDIFLRELAKGREVVGHYRNGPIDIVGLRSRRAPARSPR